MNLRETAQDRAAAQRRQKLLDRIEEEQRAQREREAQLAQIAVEQQLARRAEALAARRAAELLARQERTSQEERQREAELARMRDDARAAALRSQRQEHEQEIQAEEALKREERGRTGVLREQQQKERRQIDAAKSPEKQRLARERQDAAKRQEEELRAAASREEQRGRERQIQAAQLREEQESTQEAEARRKRQREERRAAALRKRDEERQQEIRAVKILGDERAAQQKDAAPTQHEEELQATAQRRKRRQENARRTAQALEEQQQALEERQRLEQENLQRIALKREQDAREQLRSRQQQELREARSHSEARRQRAMERRALARKEFEAAHIEPTARRPRTEEIEAEEASQEPLPLRTQDKFIVDSNSDSIDLRGITLAGLDRLTRASGQTFRSALSLDDRNISVITELWDVNLVRLPVQPKTILSGNSVMAAEDVLAGLDDAIRAVTMAGAYVLLALEMPGAGESQRVTHAEAFRSAQLLAGRYREDPGVLYEIFPAAPPPEWLQIAAVSVGVIRRQNPASLIFLGSGKGGGDVAGLPLRSSAGQPIFNLVYTIDISKRESLHEGERQWPILAQSYPVFASSWSSDAADMGRSSERAARSFERYGIGWAASSWNAEPRLIANAANHDFSPTAWGRIVQRALRLPVRPLLKPFTRVASHS